MPLSRWLIAAWRRLVPPRSLGQRGEDAAARYLKRQGCIIVGRRERDGLGEIDLVAIEGRTVVFVEVKTRSAESETGPEEAVDTEKQRRMTRLAMGYLRRHHLLEYPARFDVVAVVWPPGQKKPQIEHFKNAFEPVAKGQMFG